MLRDLFNDGAFSFRVWRGRFAEEVNAVVMRGGEVVAYAKIFFGRPPYYGPWAELFNLRVLGTPVEAELYRLFARYMEAGDLLYVEYLDDRETARQLAAGVPPAETRMGRHLESCGFRVVRDWYHPEGWLEGTPKLQAVRLPKPLPEVEPCDYGEGMPGRGGEGHV
ncbi:DUF1122 family protein [Pyrobaculum neutrophilum]|uniref:DUF1122 domain-containing protein n=1 Tax=Pyrobaculum neutrophilum (strain DSM 2338 / JCM 9278 / NBRC 100436 / V24Sta) TaxID=444157 RepID=B1YBZ0_PYRNV|nr:DUF1122 family protein [Pyrobaculum neutrophilum]ACB39374.1 conserved hypothetical protein [Pyrobaculum neutrophilum V24Sta]